MIIKFFATHKTAANLLMITFLMLGLFSLDKLKRETMPEFLSDVIQVSAHYPGATAEEIEEAVGLPIEEALNKISNVNRFRTTATEGAVSILAEMREGGNFQEFYNDIKTNVDAIKSFPGELKNLTVKSYNRHSDQVVSIAIFGDIDAMSLKVYCEKLKKKLLLASPGMLIDIGGFGQREFRIETDMETLIKHGVSLTDIANIIRIQNKNLPLGTLETSEQDIKVRFDDRSRTAESLKEIRIKSSATGSELRLGDIAKITDRFVSDASKITFDGNNSAIISVSKSKSADSLVIYDAVMKIIDEERLKLPGKLSLVITQDSASQIRDRLGMIGMNLIEGIILVFLTLWLFLNIKISFWVAMGLPVSFLGGLFFMRIFGISLNMISTFALLIATGLLMDDAIVIAENIARRVREKGENPLDACVNGCAEVANGVIASFSTTICIFAPLMFLSGNIGKILRIIPITLIIVLCVSLIEAFFVLPNHLKHSFNGEGGYVRKKINSGISFFQDRIIGAAVAKCVKYRYIVIAMALGLFIFSIAQFPAGNLKFNVFPQIDGDTVACRVQLPPGTPLSESERIAGELSQAALAVGDVVRYVSVSHSVNSDVQDSGAHVFTVFADLIPGDKRRVTVNEVLSAWRGNSPEIPGAMSVTYSDTNEGPGGKAIEIMLLGDNIEQLKLASSALKKKLSEYTGTKDIADNMTVGKPEIVIKLKSGALALGITANDIAAQLRAAYQGEKVDEIQIGSENYEFNIRLSSHLEENLRAFDNFKIIVNGKPVNLSSVAELKTARGLSVIDRYNGQRAVTVNANIDETEGNAQEITEDLFSNFMPGMTQDYGVSYRFGGNREAGSETGSSMLSAFIIGIFGIFVILSIQFSSWFLPLIIMSAIPLSMIGVIWGHILAGAIFSLPSVIGMISLVGVVVNDSILMIEFIKMGETEGQSPLAAARKAASARFRAIIMTSTTTIAGLLPLLLEKSLQAQMIVPIALSIASGLAAATLLVLFVVPSLYVISADFKKR